MTSVSIVACLPVTLHTYEEYVVAVCPSLDVAGWGDTKRDAINNVLRNIEEHLRENK